MRKPIYEVTINGINGKIFSTTLGYYYRVYYPINGRKRLIGCSYVNLFDYDVCLEQMLHYIDLVSNDKHIKPLK